MNHSLRNVIDDDQEQLYRTLIKVVNDYPVPGVRFVDLNPLYSNNIASALHVISESLVNTWDGLSVDSTGDDDNPTVVAVESRGYIIGSVIAGWIDGGFIPLRKKKATTRHTEETVYHTIYSTEYSSDNIIYLPKSLMNVREYIIVDDVLATGGTASAAASLVEKAGGKVVGFMFIVEVDSLKGRALLQTKYPDVPCISAFVY